MSKITDVGAAYDKQFEKVDTVTYPLSAIADDTCNHDLAEQETACADGFCPICATAEIVRLTKLQDELAEAKKDAERYRWLRDNTCKNSLYAHCGIEGSDTEVMISGEVLDAAIDAAIDETMKEGK
jgi:hypothetical protein